MNTGVQPRAAQELSEPGRAILAAANISEFLDVWLSNDLLDGDAAKTFATYYRSYLKSFTPRMRHFYADQIREVEDVIAGKSNASILEVGCGLGTESLWLALKGGRVRAIDVREDRVDTAKTRHSILEREIGRPVACTFHCGSFLDIDDRESFDVIWMEQAFHHLEPRSQVVRNIADLLKPGGHLVVSEANALNPILQLELFVRRGFPRVATQEGPDGKLHPYGVERVTTARALAKGFDRVGIRCLSVRHFRMFPNKPIFNRFAKFETGLASNALGPLLTHFNYVGQNAACQEPT